MVNVEKWLNESLEREGLDATVKRSPDAWQLRIVVVC